MKDDDDQLRRDPSPLGRLLVAADAAGLRQIRFLDGNEAGPASGWREAPGVVAEPVRQLQEYVAGSRRAFELRLAPVGTPFQLRVWQALTGIPYGETIAHGELARRVGKPRAIRAVGLANGRNPLPIVIPCHRLIGANGQLTGYGGGLPRKELLLALEAGQSWLGAEGGKGRGARAPVVA